KVCPDCAQLPAGWILQETPGIAADRNEHVFVFSRGEHAIIEFDRDGKMIRSFGERVFVRPPGVRFDPEGNLWAIDDGGHFVVKLDSAGRVRMVPGRNRAPGEKAAHFTTP